MTSKSDCGELPLSPQLRRIMRLAAIEAESQQASGVEPIHVMAALFQDGRNEAHLFFVQQGVTLEAIRTTSFITEPKA